MTPSAASRDDTTLPGWTPADVAERPTTRPIVPAPLLFALGFATALPPATLRPPAETLPTVYRLTDSTIRLDQVSASMGRPVCVAGCGEIPLDQVDARLAGLAASLEVFQAVGESSALAALSVVRPAAASRPGATVAGLWRLARAESARRSVTWERPPDPGDDAFQATYGNTIQVAWLIGGRVATVTLTDLYEDRVRSSRTADAWRRSPSRR